MNDNDISNMIKKAQEMINNNQIPDELKNMVANMQNNSIDNNMNSNNHNMTNNSNTNRNTMNSNYYNSNKFTANNVSKNNYNKPDYNKYSSTYSRKNNINQNYMQESNNNRNRNFQNSNINNVENNVNNNSSGNFDLNGIGDLLKNFQANNSNNDNTNNDDNGFNLDIDTMMKIQNVMSKMKSVNSNDDMSKLLMSLKPYLRDEKKGKVDEYIKLIKMGKMTQFFDGFGGDKK